MVLNNLFPTRLLTIAYYGLQAGRYARWFSLVTLRFILEALRLLALLTAVLATLVVTIIELMEDKPEQEHEEVSEQPIEVEPEHFIPAPPVYSAKEWKLDEVLVVKEYETDLMHLTVRELKAMAKDRKLPGYGRMKKAELAAALA